MNVTIEETVCRIIQMGRNRCGLGFGKYPLGIRDAVEELLRIPEVAESARVQDRLRNLDERLKE